MNKEEILLKLKDMCNKLLEENTPKKKTYESIMNILNVPDAFSFIGVETSLNVLLDLGFTKQEATKLYALLIA